MDYLIIMPELHYQEIVVNAKSEEEALNFAHAGDGDYGDTYYSRTLGRHEQEWGVQAFNVFDKTYPTPAFGTGSGCSSHGSSKGE